MDRDEHLSAYEVFGPTMRTAKDALTGKVHFSPTMFAALKVMNFGGLK
jgi:hypothetical protein